ncbi:MULTISPECIES: YlbL family protein [Paenibacillus]|uniref:YlbL family protein n=1 Tax=Paenibacillus TaxID=44249 RepID=UPI0022B8649D|nr:PDZ domain-containing protein [Paenibacillus caseinilyticus]MCZ8520103.1 PDZ domain-containing protein [Paenibacillus caseinilyticus]
MGETRHIKQASRIVFSVFGAILLLYFIYFMPLPLYIFKPGSADVIGPMVKVGEAGPEDRGELMLTTVSVSNANIAGYLLSFVMPYQERQPKQDLLKEGETEEEYTQRQEVVMLTSQADAMQAAYNKLGVPYRISKDGVVLQRVYTGFPAHDVLLPGDYLVKIDDRQVEAYEDVRSALQDKKEGDKASVTFKRGSALRTEEIGLKTLPVQPGETGGPRVGLGVEPAEVHSIKAESEKQQVSIQAGEIGGPSAGLMFSLEIYNKLVPEDITKGYRIAGTGVIDPQGTVGVIGGIQHKVVAADRAGAEIFFAPKDVTMDGKTIANYSVAEQRAEEIGTKMKVVPVGTMQDALDYMAALPAKTGG